MYAAVTRLSPATGLSPAGEGGWYPEEKLSVEQAVRGFTRNAAYGWGKEKATGAVEVGKWADWVVLDRDLWEVGKVEGKENGLRDVVVKETWVGGRRVLPVDEVQERWGERLERWVEWAVQRGKSTWEYGWRVLG